MSEPRSLDGILDGIKDIQRETKRRTPICRPSIAFKVVFKLLTAIAVTLYAVYKLWLSEDHFYKEQRNAVREPGQQILNSLRAQLETSVSATEALAALIQIDYGVSLLHPLGPEVLQLQKTSEGLAMGVPNASSSKDLAKSDLIDKMHAANFNKVAESMLHTYKGISNLQLAPQGVVSVIHPLHDNEGAIGHDLFYDEARREGAIQTIRARKVIFVGPLSLKQNGRTAILARFPVIIPNASFTGAFLEEPDWWGFTTMLAEIDDLIKNTALAPLRSSEEYSFVLYAKNDEKRILVTASQSVPGQPEKATDDLEMAWWKHAQEHDPVSVLLQIPELNIDWVMEIWPQDGWKDHADMFVPSILLSCFTLLTSAVSVYVVAMRDSVQFLVSEKSSKLIGILEEVLKFNTAVASSVGMMSPGMSLREASHESHEITPCDSRLLWL